MSLRTIHPLDQRRRRTHLPSDLDLYAEHYVQDTIEPDDVSVVINQAGINLNQRPVNDYIKE